MKLQALVDQILTEKAITPSLEQQINVLLWSPEVDWHDLQALELLVDGLLDGEIDCSSYS